MLDPLTSLSLASTVLQLVEFGSELIKEGSELYCSVDGVLSKNIELETITLNLKDLANK